MGRALMVGIVLLCALVGALVLGVVPVFAGFAYRFERELVPSGGQFGFLDAGSVAIGDADGQTYVADSGSGVVDV